MIKNTFDESTDNLLEQMSNDLLTKGQKVGDIVKNKAQVEYWNFMKLFIIISTTTTGFTSFLLLIGQFTGLITINS